jgi:hypothetical protein
VTREQRKLLEDAIREAEGLSRALELIGRLSASEEMIVTIIHPMKRVLELEESADVTVE